MRALRGLAVSLVMMSNLLVLGSGSTPAAADVEPGCDPDRKAVAHNAGAAVLDPQPDRGPIVCATYTGFPAGESRLNVTNDGTVMFSPAAYNRGILGLGYGPDDRPTARQWMFNNGGIAVTHDRGAHWHLSLPLGASWTMDDALAFYDRDTGRYFWVALNSNPFPQTTLGVREQGVLTETRIMFTDDNGRTWGIGNAVGQISDRFGFASAWNIPGQAPSINYPKVLYYCHAFPPLSGFCSRSLNGGADWTLRGRSHGNGVHPECAGASEGNGHSFDSLVPMPDGSVVKIVTCNDQAYLARTRDHAETWPFDRVTGSDEPLVLPNAGDLRSDDEGTLYLLRRVDGAKLMLRFSHDEGQTWSDEIDVTAPGIGAVHSNWYFNVREPGHLAFTYNARREGQEETYDGYITQTRDVFDPSPVLWSAMINDPDVPLLYGDSLRGVDGGMPPLPPPQVNQSGTDISPDGSAWGSFTEDCGTSPEAEKCQQQNVQTRGLAGRLLWP